MNILYLSLERNIELENKHKVMYLDYTSRKDKLRGDFPQKIYKQILEFKPDVLIEREFNDGLSKYVGILSFVKKELPLCKRSVWLIDTHVQLQWHLDYSPLFDYIFVAISKYRPIIASNLRTMGSSSQVFWLPLCYPCRRDKIKRNKSRVPFDIVFVGRWGEWFGRRNELIKALTKKYKDRFFPITDYANMEDYIRQGVISFNCSYADDMNFRVFETMANGVELVTNDVPDLHLIEGLAERINIYKTDKELFKLCDKILAGKRENDVIRSQIWIQNHHCTIHRHKEMLKMMREGEQVKY